MEGTDMRCDSGG